MIIIKGAAMSHYTSTYEKQLIHEIEAMPDEYLPALLGLIRLFRQSVTLKTAEDSFRQGWKEAQSGESLPISDLCNGINDD